MNSSSDRELADSACPRLLASPFKIGVNQNAGTAEQYYREKNDMGPLSRDEGSQDHENSAPDKNPASEAMCLFPYPVAR
jgi:hypothetical protein